MFFQTWVESEKIKALQNGTNKTASIVIGFSEKDNLTLQMRGTLRIVSDPEELENIYKVHYTKHSFAEKHKTPETRFIEFTPAWWRYSDFNTTPETVIESN